MFTDQELKELHYKMWNYIIKRLRKYEDDPSDYDICASIEELKEEFFKHNNIQDDITNKCFLCEYTVNHGDGVFIDCLICPSILKSNSALCLSGVYDAVCTVRNVYVKVALSRLIRNSWR